MPATNRPGLYLVSSTAADEPVVRRTGDRLVSRLRLAVGIFRERVTVRYRRDRIVVLEPGMNRRCAGRAQWRTIVTEELRVAAKHVASQRL